MKRTIFLLMSFLLLLLAQANVAFACGLFWYQPEVPRALKQ